MDRTLQQGDFYYQNHQYNKALSCYQEASKKLNNEALKSNDKTRYNEIEKRAEYLLHFDIFSNFSIC